MKKRLIDKFSVGVLSFRKQWNEAVEHVRESQRYIYVVIGLFVVSAVLGYVFSSRLGFIDKFLRDLLLQTQDMGGFELTFFILQNNLMSGFLSFVLGIFFGVFPLITTLTNGVVLGYVFSRTVEIVGVFELWRILPHGIFELPAIFIALGIGLRFGGAIFSGKRGYVKEQFYKGINVFLMIVLPLLIVAAIIEGILIALFISGRFLSLQELVGLTDVNPILLRKVLGDLEEKYKDSGIVLVKRDNMWKMDVSPDHVSMVNRLASGNSEFTRAEQESLAIIAYKNPMKQSVLVKIRGNKAYEHVKKFVEMGLVSKKRIGHTSELSLKDEFYDYFHLGKGEKLREVVGEEDGA
jgi:stage II sporulation protein M